MPKLIFSALKTRGSRATSRKLSSPTDAARVANAANGSNTMRHKQRNVYPNVNPKPGNTV